MAALPAIPGETPIDISGLTPRARARGAATRAELSFLEAEGINTAFAKYFGARTKLSRRTAPFTFRWCLRTHFEMFGGVWTWAGRIRVRNLNLGCDHGMIAEELQRLLDDLHSWPSFGMNLLEQSVRLHHRAVKIHPFENGNGRWARLLGNIWLRRHAEPIVAWPDQLINRVSPERETYLAAVRQADFGNYQPLIEFHQAHRRDN